MKRYAGLIRAVASSTTAFLIAIGRIRRAELKMFSLYLEYIPGPDRRASIPKRTLINRLCHFWASGSFIIGRIIFSRHNILWSSLKLCFVSIPQWEGWMILRSFLLTLPAFLA